MRFSKIISLFLHPVFMPTLALYLTLNLVESIRLVSAYYFTNLYMIVLVCTVALPLISVFFLIKNKLISSLEMADKKERSLPLLITGICISYGYYLLSNILSVSPILKSEIFGAMIIVFISSIVSRFWKISLHMLGVGGVAGVLFSLNFLYGGLLNEFILMVLLSGLLGVARINENAHNHPQVYIGFLIGFLIEIVAILFFQNHINNFNLSFLHSINTIY